MDCCIRSPWVALAMLVINDHVLKVYALPVHRDGPCLRLPNHVLLRVIVLLAEALLQQ